MKKRGFTLKKQSSDPAREPITAINVKKRQSNMTCIPSQNIHIERGKCERRQRVIVTLAVDLFHFHGVSFSSL
jgi:hypothetical protein